MLEALRARARVSRAGSAEQPVVAKQARVVEEIVVTKGVDTRTETSGAAGWQAYEPAYRVGHQLRGDQRCASSKRWDDIEPNARSDWEKQSPGTWDRMKDAVRHACENVKR